MSKKNKHEQVDESVVLLPVPADAPTVRLLDRVKSNKWILSTVALGIAFVYLLGYSDGSDVVKVSQTCKVFDSGRVCVPSESEDGAPIVKITSDGWARYSDGDKWNGKSFQ